MPSKPPIIALALNLGQLKKKMVKNLKQQQQLS